MDILTLVKACETDDDSKAELNGNIFTIYNLQDNILTNWSEPLWASRTNREQKKKSRKR